MDVVTEKELKEKKGGAKKAPSDLKEKKSAVTKSKKKPDVEFECGFAPLGDSNITIVHNYEGKEYTYKLELKNKRYKLPNDLKPEEIKRYRTALIANSFVDVSVMEGITKFDKEKSRFIYRVMHPEHTNRNRINATMSLILHDDKGHIMYDAKTKQQITEQVTINEGVVVTANPLIYKALLDAGFADAGKAEKKEE